jgi:hypothetical protein
MADEIRLSSGLQLFEPRSRHAVLLNSFDISDEYSQTIMWCRGNRSVYGLEAVLSGKFGKGPEQFEPALGKRLQLKFGFELELHQRYRQGIAYDSVSRVLPQTEMRGELYRNLERISSNASDDTLTFMYIISHGKPNSFAIDNEQEMSYRDLLDSLDEIKGKKAIAALACYSGSLIDALRERKRKDDYIILTSTANGEQGITWGEDELHDIIVENLLANRKVSDQGIPFVIKSTHDKHHPQIVGSYDLIL